MPKAGDTLVNKDYASTLREIAKGGAEAFYRGAIARRIADDMDKNGGLITLDDLAQYRAIERKPLAGRYRDNTVYSVPPPVSSGGYSSAGSPTRRKAAAPQVICTHPLGCS